MMAINVSERAERVRDLKTQISELRAEDEGEILFIDASPQRRLATLYSTLDGEPILFPAYMVEAILSKQRDGKYLFVSDPGRAPEYKRGTVKCFLHIDAPERVILEEIGLGSKECPAGSLASTHSKRIHALRRHKDEWAAYQEYINDQKEAVREARQEKQLEATLALA